MCHVPWLNRVLRGGMAPGVRLQHVSRVLVTLINARAEGILVYYGTWGQQHVSRVLVTALLQGRRLGWLMRPNCGVQQWSSPLNTAARVNSNWLQFITPHLVPHRFVPGPGPVGWSKAKRSNKREERGHGKGEADNYCKAPGSFLYAIQVFNTIFVRQNLITCLPLMYFNLFDQIWPTVLTPAPCPPDLLHTG